MDRRRMRKPATFAVAAVAIAWLPQTLVAQAPGPTDAAQFDPPGTKYATGSLENDPEVESATPMAPHHRAYLPVAVDLTSRMPTVGDQGNSQSCVAWATAYAARSYYTGALERRNIAAAENLPSPSYVYHLARPAGCDVGTSFARVGAVLRHGALSMAEAPFTDACVSPAPPAVVARAHDFRIRGWNRVDYTRPNDVKGQLAKSNPVLIDFQVSSAFQNWRGSRTFMEPRPFANDKDAGWHAMTLIGYDERRQAFRVQNSWGTGWGDSGYAWLGYDILRTRVRGTYVLDVGPLRPRPVADVTPPRPPVVQPAPKPAPVVQPTPPKPAPVVQPTPPKPAPVVQPQPPQPVTVTATRPGVALIIGNSGYARGQLATSRANADVVAETLRGAGYNVTELYDTRKDEIRGALRGFLDQVAAAGPDAVAFFYFAGDVAQAGGRNYLVPVDAEIAGVNDVPRQGLRLDGLVDELARLPAAARILVVDAAHEHGYGQGTPDLVPPGLAAMTAPAGTMIAFAAAPGRIAAQNAGPYTLYTATLVRLMRQTGVELDEAFKATRQQVQELSHGDAVPWTTGNLPVRITLFPAAPTPPTPVGPAPAPNVPPAPVVTTPVVPAPVPGLRLADLQTLACGRVTVDTRGGQSILNGYVASDDDLNRVKLIAASVPGTSLGNVLVAPWPQCEALQTLEKPLAIEDRPTIDIGPAAQLHGGELLKIQVRAPAKISYLYVSYIQADGSVVHLVQPSGLVPQPTLPRQLLVFGSGEGGAPKFTISPPFGREMIIAIASRSPLFDQALPPQQTERDYLSDLRRALIYKPDPNMPDRELAAAITTLQTSER